ncbi:unnamed protein product [Fusarium venenatum]|uniref:C2H2-type domain-containing protein n=1 Tax=Fusarium venenatum TaxID=56646 RepID=A0A2L2T3X6_9HYPO|nr:uncharacterized protein FVRRES_00970 [Fusarium venenatum]CEI64458.1 unnamed protein product [Fusarium venenatum]
MSRRSDRPHRHSRSSKSRQEDIPVDPNLTTGASYLQYNETEGYSQADPTVSDPTESQDTSQMAYYMMQQQQPATVNPNEVLLNPGLSYTSQSYPSSAYQTDTEAEPEASSSAAQPPSQYHCSECDRFFPGNRDFNKHMKIHDKPVKCKADASCKVTKAEQRDMDRHYRSSHRAYAASKGILTEDAVCGFQGCTSKFTRKDNLLKHWKKFHGYERSGN